MKQKLFTKLLLLSVFTSLSVALFAQKETDAIPTDPSVKIGKLPNGLTYYIRKNAKPEKKIELRLAINAGSVLEKNEQQGVAHFLEHMAFNGTKNFPKNQLTEYLGKSGVRFGADLNASTGFDETIYMLPISSADPKVVSNGFQIIRDWAGNLLFDQGEIDKERGIILEEKRMRQGASMRMMTKYFPTLSNGSMYGSRIPIGQESIIKTAPRKTFVDFYNTWYRPNNMAVIVVGDVDIADAEAKIKKLFGDLKNPANGPVRPSIIPIQWHKTNKAQIVTDAENTNDVLQIYVGLNKKTDNSKWSSYGDDLLNESIDALFSSRLQEYGLKANSPIGFGGISAAGGLFRGYNSLTLFALVKKNPTDAINTVVGELLKAKQYGFTQAEFDRVKEETLKNYQDMAAEKDKTESASFAGEYIRNFLEHVAMPGIEAEKKFTDLYMSTLTLAKINEVVKKMDLNTPTFILYTINNNKDLVKESDLLTAFENAKKQTVEAYVEKEVSKEFIEQLPAVGTITKSETNADFNSTSLFLSNGMKVIYKKTDYKNDEVVMRGYQWGGLSNLPEADAKLAKYLLIINQLGLGSHNAGELQKMMTGVKATSIINFSNNNLSLFGNSNVVDFEKMLQILHLKLTNINFDASEVDGIKSSFGSQLGMMKKNPSFYFGDTLNKFRYNNNVRLSGLPDAKELEQVDAKALEALYKKLTSNLRGTVIELVGNIDESKIKALVEKYIASIPTKAETVALNEANILRPIKGNNSFIVKGGKENKSEINLSYYGNLTAYDDKENMSYGLMAEIIQMKTTEKLREEMGSTYSPRAGGQMSRAPMLEYNLNLVVSSAPENVEKLAVAFDGIIKSVIAGNVTADDLLKAKEQRKKLIETQMKTNNYWVSAIENQDMYKSNPTLITTYFKRLEATTKEDIVAIAKKYLSNTSILKAVMNPE